MTFAPPLRLRLDSDALIANWKMMAALSGSAATGAAVKANAYGLGAREVVQRLWQAGCRDFFVAHWAEAEAIADLIPASAIAVLNGICADDVPGALALGARPVLNTPEQLALWKNAGGGQCHVMLDSGINRLGIGPEQLRDNIFDGLEIDVLLSHLASADEDVAQNGEQLRIFSEMAAGIQARRKSLANSAGVALGQEYCFDLTRPGLALYGGKPTPAFENIRQVVRPEARILQIRTLPEGAPVGYNATFYTTRETRIATLAIGYADGYFRGFSDKGTARLGGNVLPVIGRVSMDLIIVDVTLAKELREGDMVQIDFDLATAAAASGMAQYELLTGLGARAERVWF